MTILNGLPHHIYAFAAILAALLLGFILFFVLPALVVSRQLSAVTKRLAELDGVPAEDMGAIFRNRGVLWHLWLEYADSLHRQAEGESVRLRSTLPAGAIFRPDILIDIPLRTDFFKHLPGLFTGVGIIGTFYGLLVGMKSFSVSSDAATVRDSLTRLLHGVSEAFLISASAITLAMIVTFVEKLAIARLGAESEKLAQLLDGLFEGGAGEEYLARLVKSSESAPSQMAEILKNELKKMLAEMHERQIAASTAHAVALAERISQGMKAALEKPLLEIADALKGSRAETARLFEELGNQMKLQSSLQQKALEAMESSAAGMGAAAASQQGMAEAVVKSGEEAASRLSVIQESLANLIEKGLTRNGSGSPDGIAAFADAIGEMRAAADEVSSAFSDAATKMNSAGQSMEKAANHVGTLFENSASVSERFSESAAAIAAATSGLSGMFEDYKAERLALARQVESLQSLLEQVKKEASMSGEALERMEASAARLASAQKDAEVFLSRISDVIGAAHQSFSEGMSRAVGEANREFHQALTDSVRLLREGIHELESALDAGLPHAE